MHACHVNSSFPTIFDDLLKPFNKQISYNTRGESRYILNILKKKENRETVTFNQWGYFDHFIIAIAQRTKVIKLNQLCLYDKQTDHI